MSAFFEVVGFLLCVVVGLCALAYALGLLKFDISVDDDMGD